jgi:hypothetical protein
MNGSSRPDSGLDDFDLCKARKEYDAYVQAAREHHARTGEWPPDPLLDEVAEMRRQIMAEHGTDWRKVLQGTLSRTGSMRSRIPTPGSLRSRSGRSA